MTVSGEAVPQIPELQNRQSRGLEQFLEYVKDIPGLQLLDLGGANQENISFLTSLGHKLYSEDLVRALQAGNFDTENREPMHPQEIEEFLNSTFDYPEDHFDGVLLWDTLEQLEPRLLGATIERLKTIVRPGSYLLSLFHAQEKAKVVPVYSYRIYDFRTLALTHRGWRKPLQYFNNRGLEKLFQDFESVKFFLSRDNLRDVIVRR